MMHQWYWQTEGEQHGPLSTEELEDLVRRNRIKDGDRIRVDGTADWLSATEVKAIFAAQAEASASETAAESAARVLAGANRPHVDLTRRKDSWGAESARLVGKGIQKPVDFLESVRDWLAANLGRLLDLFRRKTTLAVVFALLLVVIWRNAGISDTLTPVAHAEFTDTYEQVRGMIKRKASPAEWQEFEQETMVYLKLMNHDLRESALRNTAGYDFWPFLQYRKAAAQFDLERAGVALAEAISMAKKPPTTAKPPVDKAATGKPRPVTYQPAKKVPPEVDFLKYMSSVEKYLKGDYAGYAPATMWGKAPTRAEVTAKLKSEAKPKPEAKPESEARPEAAAQVTLATSASQIDPFTVGMVVIDVIVVAGVFVIWWMRRLRSN